MNSGEHFIDQSELDARLTQKLEDPRFAPIYLGPIDRPVLKSPSLIFVSYLFCVFFDVVRRDFSLKAAGEMLSYHPLFSCDANIIFVLFEGREELTIDWHFPVTDELCKKETAAIAACHAAAIGRRRCGSKIAIRAPNADYSSSAEGGSYRVRINIPNR